MFGTRKTYLHILKAYWQNFSIERLVVTRFWGRN